MNIAEKLIFAELLKCKGNHINNIQMSFVRANAIKTIARVGVMSSTRKGESWKFDLADILTCKVDRINHIQMSFLQRNAIETIAVVGVVSLPSKNQ